jgi:hypothetical protein
MGKLSDRLAYPGWGTPYDQQNQYMPVPKRSAMSVAGPAIGDALKMAIGAPSQDEGAQMQAQSGLFQQAFADRDRRGMAEAIGQQAGVMAPYMAGAGVIKAYHGSPHSFDKFRMDRIGTGEGAQAYGHGLYFAESEDVARSYRDALAPQNANVQATLRQNDGDFQKAIEEAKRRVTHYENMEPSSRRDGLLNLNKMKLEELESQASGAAPNPGSMYEVNINANPDDFLDWDKPLSQQSAKVRDTVKSQIKKSSPWLDDDTIPDMAGDKIFYSPGSVSPSGNTAAFQEAGIPGIKFLDQSSRNVGSGSRNYVVFDENLISIVKKYGIAGAVAAGLLTNEQAQAFMDQQAPDTGL